MPDTYAIELFRTARHWAPRYELYWMDNRAEWEELNFVSALVRGRNKSILINTGLPRNYAQADQFWRSWDVRTNTTVAPGEHVVDQLAARGVKPEDVTDVLVTPMTVYATGNLDLFPNAVIHVSKRGWIDYQTPDPYSHQLPRPIVMPDHVHAYLTTTGWPKLRLLGEDDRVADGIRATWVGTHHRSSMAFVIDTNVGRVALTDCAFKYPNIEQQRPLGIQESMEECLRAYDWLRHEADVVVPLYDPEIFTRHPNGLIG